MPLNMNQGHTETKHLKDKDKTPTIMVHAGYINENTTLCMPKEEEWSKDTLEDRHLGCIKDILSGTEEKPIDPKELNNKACVKHFQLGCLEFPNGLISYYSTP